MDTAKIGFFVIVSVVLATIMITIFGGGFSFRKTIRIETYIDESVQDLAPGSSVEYRGVQVGKVAEIGFVQSKYSVSKGDDSRYVLVEIDLFGDVMDALAGKEVNEWIAAEVERGMRIRIASQGVTGPSYLEIDYPTLGVEKSIQVLWTPTNPYLPYTPSVSTRLGDVLDSISTISDELRRSNLLPTIQIFAKTIDAIRMKLDENGNESLPNKIATLVTDLGVTNKQLRIMLESIDVLTLQQNLNSMIKHYDEMAKGITERKIPDGVADLVAEARDTNKALNDFIHGDELRKALRDGQEAVSAIREIVIDVHPDVRGTLKSMHVASDKISQSTTDLTRKASLSMEEFRAMMNAITELAASVQSLSEDMRQDPSRILFSKPPPKSFPEK